MRGAELELEITLLKNFVNDPDLTVHKSCRNGKEKDRTADDAADAQTDAHGHRAGGVGDVEGGDLSGDYVSPTKAVQAQPTLYMLVLESILVEGVKDAISDLSTCWLEIVLRKPEGITSLTKSNRILWPRAHEQNEQVCFGKISIKVKASDLGTSYLEVRLCRRLEGQIKYVFGKAKSKPLETLNRREESEEQSEPVENEADETAYPVDPSVLLSSESAVNEGHPDFVRITMRRQAAFKRNVKIKVGSVTMKMYLIPTAERGSGWNEGSLGLAPQEDYVEIEDFLQVFQDKLADGEAKLEAPPPLDLVVVQRDVAIGIDRLSVMLLSENSRFIPMYNQATGNVEVKTGSWLMNMNTDSRRELLSSEQMRRTESTASGAVEDSKSESEEVVMPSRTITFRPSHVNGARSEEVQTITTMVRWICT